MIFSVASNRRMRVIACALALFLGGSTYAQFYAKQFVDVAPQIGFGSTPEFSWGSAWGDANGDGYPDLFVSNHYQELSKNKPYLFFSTPEGKFRRDSVPFYKRTSDMHGAGWFDFDNDGDQDLTITTGRANRNSLLVNDGTGRFVERAVEYGADFPFCRGRGPLFYDHNRDGILDILVSSGPSLASDQLPTTLALSSPTCSPLCYNRVSQDSSGLLPELSSSEGLLIDPDGDDQMNPMIVTIGGQPWGAVGCLPYQTKGSTFISAAVEVLAGDFNGDLRQDLFFIRSNLDQSYVESPFPINYRRIFGLGGLNLATTQVLVDPQNGEAFISPQGNLIYTPDSGFVGKDSILVKLCDSFDVCRINVLRFVVFPTAIPLPPDILLVIADSSLSFSLKKFIHPFNHRLRSNLVIKSGPSLFSFKTNSDSIMIGFDEGPFPASQIFIGSTGYHPSTDDRFILRASDLTNTGNPSGVLPSSPALVIGYNPATQTWTFGLSSPSQFSNISSIFSHAPLKITQYINLDSVPQLLPSALLVWDNDRFRDQTSASGLEAPIEAFGGAIGDFDNDMDLDIYLTLGILGRNEPNIMFENDGNGRFTMADRAAGAAGASVGAGGTVSMADYNRDGFLDLFVASGRDLEKTGPYELFKNRGNDNRWLGFTLEGTQSNRNGYGAVVRAYAGGKAQIRYADGGIHRYVQNDPAIHFGLGKNKYADSVVVRWPSGAKTLLVNVLANQYLNIVEPLEGRWACFPSSKTSQTIEAKFGVLLQWVPVSCAQGYEVSLRGVGDATWTTVEVTDSIALVPFAALTPDTQYEWTVRAICESGTKGAFTAKRLFNTDFACDVPKNLTAFAVSPDSTLLRWNEVASAQLYVVYILAEGATSYDSTAISDNKLFLFPGILDSVSFTWYVRAFCLFGERSEASDLAFFTPPFEKLSGVASAVSLHPNPAQTTLQLSGLVTRATFRIQDIRGRELAQGITDPGQPIALGNLPSGSYRLSWAAEGTQVWHSLPFVVQ